MVHQREIRRPLETVCAESGTPLVAKRDHKAVADPEHQILGAVILFGLKMKGGGGVQAPLLDLQRTVKDWCDVTQCQGLQD